MRFADIAKQIKKDMLSLNYTQTTTFTNFEEVGRYCQNLIREAREVNQSNSIPQEFSSMIKDLVTEAVKELTDQDSNELATILIEHAYAKKTFRRFKYTVLGRIFRRLGIITD